MTEDKPKIIVDDDWKKQAQAEKQRLSEEVSEVEPQGPLPEADFLTLVSSFLTQALLAMGVLKHRNAPAGINLDLAKFNIGMLEMLEQKTMGNVTDEEKKMLDQALHQVRMAFIEVASRQGPIG